jgi:hypothetical protein
MKWKVFRNSRTGEREVTKHTNPPDNAEAHMFCHDPENCQCICTLCKHAARRTRRNQR